MLGAINLIHSTNIWVSSEFWKWATDISVPVSGGTFLAILMCLIIGASPDHSGDVM